MSFCQSESKLRRRLVTAIGLSDLKQQLRGAGPPADTVEENMRICPQRAVTLSSRERGVMIEVTAGRLNKQIAHNIGIAESTVKVHRTHLMRKMKAHSLPELSRMADILKVTA
jgi:FixJ family two-component response regulator